MGGVVGTDGVDVDRAGRLGIGTQPIGMFGTDTVDTVGTVIVSVGNSLGTCTLGILETDGRFGVAILSVLTVGILTVGKLLGFGIDTVGTVMLPVGTVTVGRDGTDTEGTLVGNVIGCCVGIVTDPVGIGGCTLGNVGNSPVDTVGTVMFKTEPVGKVTFGRVTEIPGLTVATLFTEYMYPGGQLTTGIDDVAGRDGVVATEFVLGREGMVVVDGVAGVDVGVGIDGVV